MTADARAVGGESAKSAGGRPGAGRPRDSRIDTAVIAATRELICETGYPALSLSAIAARAGTTTASIYRRWSGKAQLVHEAVLDAEAIPAPGGSGDLRDDIRVLVETIRDLFDRPEVRVALPGLIADTVADPELHGQMIARLAGNLTAFESRFGQGRRGGDQLPMLAEVVAGTAIFRILVRRDAALDDTWVTEMTELITGRWPGSAG
ncbi:MULTISPECIES: TetR/AcrR family transcriptional regulator [unclassified Dietzia]|uniref:TetR/AcrR family transcriptional regulator n=1 Tax=unclassified Dietzia TaxID=2617939 RepID=UPI000D205CAF|nr:MULTISPECIES: TetR/AcrR family transcriptional regulator [unclassified Dietzia]AVZ40796.1 TetR family transcriptional regulator [Dietzia sp. JS16-p6b]MBB1023915.1 TetR/AcrR family transcriptional regulator [Dietzia sp. DQ12-76]MBB1026121.1 TetR/AcrR family transcriptional regulator [Dietzia sp. DQ11-38-2]QGW26399.1 putative TetR family transcriptional regulator [Dietzia sp. DQ12-45-1b]